ncbi:MAG: aminotransferase class I/II-fold pyridoxal phosphate-dependent enzyme [Planctomycetaceae bacterium]|nr:aminotransferase class I/II-fold pyridoxal phosphate-dependent enzyme [Planctomycetaceae bacterium]
MTFRKIDYLEWARTHMGRVKVDLAKSNVKALTREELGLTLDQVHLSSPTEDGVVELRELLAKRYGLPRSQVLVTSGATQAIFLAGAAAIGEGDKVLLESPYYEPLYRALEERGAEIVMLERRFERGWQIELEELERLAGRSTRAIVLTNMHNPSGAATSPEKLGQIGQIARDYGATVVVSEVYLDNAFAPGHKPAAALGPNLVSIGSLSKVYGLGGLRLGWMAGPEPLIRKARLILDYIECDLPAPSESIALAALKKGPELVLRCQQIAMRNFKIVGEWIAKRGDLHWVEPAGGTVCMIKLPPAIDAQALAALLREKFSTLVVPGDFFSVRGFIRVSAGMDEDVLRQGLKNIGKAIDLLQAESA